MRRIIFILILSCFCYLVNAQSLGKLLSLHEISSFQAEARVALKEQNINDALSLYAKAVSYELDNRNSGKGVDGDLLAEYAYALALHRDFEAALIHLDRAYALHKIYLDYFAGRVLMVMAYKDAANELLKTAKAPEWLQDDLPMLKQVLKQTETIIQANPDESLRRANKLAANGQPMQSIAIFEELMTMFPSSPIIYIDYSTVWESIGHYEYAAQLLQKGIDLMPMDYPSRHVFSNHLSKLKNTKDAFKPMSIIKKSQLKMMTYIGATVAKDIYSLNGRIGVYTSNKFSASLNVGANYAAKQFSGSVGLSAYKAWGCLFGGLGITDNFSKDSNTLSLTPSVGLTFLNKDQTSSLDITLSGYIPFSKDGKFSYSVSIGKTIYFDFNGLFKK